jgi:HEAT repeat protein
VISALADLRATDAFGDIVAVLDTTGGWENQLVVMALVRMGPELAPLIGAELARGGGPAKLRALLGLTGRLGAASNALLVRELAHHPDVEVRIAAVRTLGALPADQESIATCLAALSDAEWAVRALAARSLGRLGDTRAVPLLEADMGDPAYWVRHHVAEALGALDEAGDAALRRGLANANPFVRDMAAQVLFMRARGAAA